MKRFNRNYIWMLLVLFCTIVLASGCPGKPTEEIADAEAALSAAREAQAPEYAAEKYNSAEDMLNQAREMAESNKNRKAKELALSAKELAEEAKEEAVQEAMRVKGLKEEEIRKLREAALSGSDITGRGALGEGVTITRMENIYYDFDKSSIREDAREVLQRNAQWLKDNGSVKIQIEGHCDERGTEEYNLALGQRRANSARSYLINLGIDSSRISTISYGEERPVEMSRGESAWSKNRRAVFVVVAE